MGADVFALVWWVFSYLTWYPLALAGRIMYVFYMLPVSAKEDASCYVICVVLLE